LEEPLVKVRQCLFFSLCTRQKIFFGVELRLEPLKVEEKLVFQLMSGIDASWQESGIPICGTSSKEMISDLARVASSPPTEAMAAL
jgi:hypothetical protein